MGIFSGPRRIDENIEAAMRELDLIEETRIRIMNRELEEIARKLDIGIVNACKKIFYRLANNDLDEETMNGYKKIFDILYIENLDVFDKEMMDDYKKIFDEMFAKSASEDMKDETQTISDNTQEIKTVEDSACQADANLSAKENPENSEQILLSSGEETSKNSKSDSAHQDVNTHVISVTGETSADEAIT